MLNAFYMPIYSKADIQQVVRMDGYIALQSGNAFLKYKNHWTCGLFYYARPLSTV